MFPPTIPKRVSLVHTSIVCVAIVVIFTRVTLQDQEWLKKERGERRKQTFQEKKQTIVTEDYQNATAQINQRTKEDRDNDIITFSTNKNDFYHVNNKLKNYPLKQFHASVKGNKLSYAQVSGKRQNDHIVDWAQINDQDTMKQENSLSKISNISQKKYQLRRETEENGTALDNTIRRYPQSLGKGKEEHFEKKNYLVSRNLTVKNHKILGDEPTRKTSLSDKKAPDRHKGNEVSVNLKKPLDQVPSSVLTEKEFAFLTLLKGHNPLQYLNNILEFKSTTHNSVDDYKNDKDNSKEHAIQLLKAKSTPALLGRKSKQYLVHLPKLGIQAHSDNNERRKVHSGKTGKSLEKADSSTVTSKEERERYESLLRKVNGIEDAFYADWRKYNRSGRDTAIQTGTPETLVNKTLRSKMLIEPSLSDINIAGQLLGSKSLDNSTVDLTDNKILSLLKNMQEKSNDESSFEKIGRADSTSFEQLNKSINNMSAASNNHINPIIKKMQQDQNDEVNFQSIGTKDSIGFEQLNSSIINNNALLDSNIGSMSKKRWQEQNEGSSIERIVTKFSKIPTQQNFIQDHLPIKLSMLNVPAAMSIKVAQVRRKYIPGLNINGTKSYDKRQDEGELPASSDKEYFHKVTLPSQNLKKKDELFFPSVRNFSSFLKHTRAHHQFLEKTFTLGSNRKNMNDKNSKQKLTEDILLGIGLNRVKKSHKPRLNSRRSEINPNIAIDNLRKIDQIKQHSWERKLPTSDTFKGQDPSQNKYLENLSKNVENVPPKPIPGLSILLDQPSKGNLKQKNSRNMVNNVKEQYEAPISKARKYKAIETVDDDDFMGDAVIGEMEVQNEDPPDDNLDLDYLVGDAVVAETPSKGKGSKNRGGKGRNRFGRRRGGGRSRRGKGGKGMGKGKFVGKDRRPRGEGDIGEHLGKEKVNDNRSNPGGTLRKGSGIERNLEKENNSPVDESDRIDNKMGEDLAVSGSGDGSSSGSGSKLNEMKAKYGGSGSGDSNLVSQKEGGYYYYYTTRIIQMSGYGANEESGNESGAGKGSKSGKGKGSKASKGKGSKISKGKAKENEEGNGSGEENGGSGSGKSGQGKGSKTSKGKGSIISKGKGKRSDEGSGSGSENIDSGSGKSGKGNESKASKGKGSKISKGKGGKISKGKGKESDKGSGGGEGNEESGGGKSSNGEGKVKVGKGKGGGKTAQAGKGKSGSGEGAGVEEGSGSGDESGTGFGSGSGTGSESGLGSGQGGGSGSEKPNISIASGSGMKKTTSASSETPPKGGKTSVLSSSGQETPKTSLLLGKGSGKGSSAGQSGSGFETTKTSMPTGSSSGNEEEPEGSGSGSENPRTSSSGSGSSGQQIELASPSVKPVVTGSGSENQGSKTGSTGPGSGSGAEKTNFSVAPGSVSGIKEPSTLLTGGSTFGSNKPKPSTASGSGSSQETGSQNLLPSTALGSGLGGVKQQTTESGSASQKSQAISGSFSSSKDSGNISETSESMSIPAEEGMSTLTSTGENTDIGFTSSNSLSESPFSLGKGESTSVKSSALPILSGMSSEASDILSEESPIAMKPTMKLTANSSLKAVNGISSKTSSVKSTPSQGGQKKMPHWPNKEQIIQFMKQFKPLLSNFGQSISIARREAICMYNDLERMYWPVPDYDQYDSFRPEQTFPDDKLCQCLDRIEKYKRKIGDPKNIINQLLDLPEEKPKNSKQPKGKPKNNSKNTDDSKASNGRGEHDKRLDKDSSESMPGSVEDQMKKDEGSPSSKEPNRSKDIVANESYEMDDDSEQKDTYSEKKEPDSDEEEDVSDMEYGEESKGDELGREPKGTVETSEPNGKGNQEIIEYIISEAKKGRGEKKNTLKKEDKVVEESGNSTSGPIDFVAALLMISRMFTEKMSKMARDRLGREKMKALERLQSQTKDLGNIFGNMSKNRKGMKDFRINRNRRKNKPVGAKEKQKSIIYLITKLPPNLPQKNKFQGLRSLTMKKKSFQKMPFNQAGLGKGNDQQQSDDMREKERMLAKVLKKKRNCFEKRGREEKKK